jgi:signal transduction histidine kinase
MKMSIKITLLFTSLAAGIILLLSGAVYYLANRYSFQDFYKRLEIRAIIAAKANFEKDQGNVSLYNEIRKEHLERLPGEQEFFLKLDATGRAAGNTSGQLLPERFYQQVLTEKKAFYRKGNVFYAALLYPDKQPEYIVLLSARNEYSTQQLRNLKNILVSGIVVAVVAALSVGLFFSRQVLKPVRRISHSVNDINTHNLHLRLPQAEGGDEIAELTHTFNNMLDRLETSFETQHNFVSNASHELRTPLTSIIGEAELALHKPRTDEQYRKSLLVILHEAERLEHITSSLLSLAQTGFDGKTQQQEILRIDELLLEVKTSADKIVLDNNCIHIDYSLLPEDELKLYTRGNPQLLKLALSNIVLNACKYSYNKPVTLALTATSEKIIIIIKDQGIGIPEKELKYIYDPFFRASNTGQFKGYGIGLPLSRNIIRMHQGDIAVSSAVGKGTVVQVSLPIYTIVS